MYGSKVSLNQKESGHGHFLCCSVGDVINGILINVISFFVSMVFSSFFPSGSQYLRLLKLFSLGIKPSSC